jgi:phenylacetate-CoA ligase
MAFYQRLVQDVLFPLSLWKRGERQQLRYLRGFEKTQFLPAEQLHSLRLDRLRKLLHHAQQNCPFYRDRFRKAGFVPADLGTLADLRALPVLEKEEIQEHGPDLLACNWPEGDRLRNQTGGSTGTPVTFYLGKERKCSRAAATLRHNAWAGWRIGDRVAVIWGAPQDRPPDTWRARLRARLLREPLWLDTGQLSEQSMERFHHTLWQYRPRIIQAYARAAVLFAQFLLTRSLSPYRPHALITSAEVLEDKERALLEEVFGCPVFNRYGCREVSVIASECPAHTGLHVMAEGLHVEIEGPARPAKPGEPGSILITDLLNPVMPLIRYRIGDMGVWARGECPCGRGLPRLERVSGRVTDFLVGCQGQLVSGVYLATYVVAQRPSLGQVQIHQDRQGAVLYRIKPGSAFHLEGDLDYLRSATRRYLGEATDVSWEIVPELAVEASGKYLFSRSTVAPTFLQGNRGKPHRATPLVGEQQ